MVYATHVPMQKIKSLINWSNREKELKDLLSKYRKNNGKFDVIVPSSGGKDSSVVAHKLKYKYNMNPLTVTWAPNIYTEIGLKNFQGLIHSGLSNILGTPNGIIHRKLTRESLIEIGDPFQPFIYGQVSFPVKVALQYDVSLIMDGENGEQEYGGSQKSSTESFSKKDEIKFWFSNFEASKWLKKGFNRKDIDIYMPPSFDEIKKKKLFENFGVIIIIGIHKITIITHLKIPILNQTQMEDQRVLIQNMHLSMML